MPEDRSQEEYWKLSDAATPEAEQADIARICERYGLRPEAVRTMRTGGGLLIGPVPDPHRGLVINI